MYDIKDIGKRIISYRKQLNMTQEELATRLNITAQAVSKWENGISFPDIGVLPELAGAFRTTMDKLFGNEGTGRSAADAETSNATWFPKRVNGTLRLVHTCHNVGCYSDKAVDVTNSDSVVFKDGSSADLKSLRVINKGPGDICFEYVDSRPAFFVDTGVTERHETFEGIRSVKMLLSKGQFEIVKSANASTTVDVAGSPLFLSRLGILKEGDLLTVKYENNNHANSGGMHQGNKVTIALGRDVGEVVQAQIVGEGQCNIRLPFEKGSLTIDGSGDIRFDSISTLDCVINGSGDISGKKAGNLKIAINGSGDFESEEIFGKLKAVINGSGDIKPGSGQVDSLEARICGSGDIDAEQICTRIANISIDGSGEVTIGRVLEESIEKHSKNSSIRVLKRG